MSDLISTNLSYTCAARLLEYLAITKFVFCLGNSTNFNERTCLSNASNFRRGRALKFEDLPSISSQVSPAYSSGKRRNKMKVNMREWWNYTDRANRSAQRTPSPILTLKP